MSQGEQDRGMISIGTALVLFAVLAVLSVITLRGIALALALIVIGGLAIKSYVHFLRSRIE